MARKKPCYYTIRVLFNHALRSVIFRNSEGRTDSEIGNCPMQALRSHYWGSVQAFLDTAALPRSHDI